MSQAKHTYDVGKLRLCAALGLKIDQVARAIGCSTKTARKALRESGLYRGWHVARHRR